LTHTVDGKLITMMTMHDSDPKSWCSERKAEEQHWGRRMWLWARA